MFPASIGRRFSALLANILQKRREERSREGERGGDLEDGVPIKSRTVVGIQKFSNEIFVADLSCEMEDRLAHLSSGGSHHIKV
jgi:hypothetical protein